MASEIYSKLKKLYPDAHCELVHSNPFELLLATILSAQCTDARVNMVTPALFKKYPSPEKLSVAKLTEVEEIIKSVNFYKNKAKSLIGCSQKLVNEFNSKVPRSVEELILLPGVGRKTANVVLGNAFDINTGIVVDTHVKRTANLLGLTKHKEPDKIELDLMKLFPSDQWTDLSHLLIFLGRRTCIARKPQCDLCSLKQVCPSKDKFLRDQKRAPRDTKSKAANKVSAP